MIRIDIIIPVHDDPRLIAAVQSVVRHPDAEMMRIIVRASRLNNVLLEQLRLVLRSHDRVTVAPDAGVFDALNSGVAESEADWIGWIGSDDILLPNFRAASLDTQPAQITHVSFTTWLCETETGRVRRYYIPVPIRLLRLAGFHVPHFSTFVRGEVARRSRFDLKWGNASDIAYFFDLERQGKGVVRYEVSTWMRLGGLSNNGWRTIASQNARVFSAIRDRVGTFSAAVFVFNKLLYKVIQSMLARVPNLRGRRVDFQAV